MMRSPLIALVILSALNAGCGAGRASGALVLADARSAAVVATEATAPSLVLRQDGSWAALVVGTVSGARQLRFSSSADGVRWSAPQAIESTGFSDQAPCLIEDASGALHAFFASNRSGENFRLYHARYQAGSWAAASEVPGFEGVQDLAIARSGDRFVLTAEVQGAGLLVAESPDGEHVGAPERLAEAGFEPAIAGMSDGRMLVAYRRGEDVWLRVGRMGEWGSEKLAATGKLREPALSWGPGGGRLVCSEKRAIGYRLKGWRVGADLALSPASEPPAQGEARTPSLATDGQGKTGLAWGMRSQGEAAQGVLFAVWGDR